MFNLGRCNASPCRTSQSPSRGLLSTGETSAATSSWLRVCCAVVLCFPLIGRKPMTVSVTRTSVKSSAVTDSTEVCGTRLKPQCMASPVSGSSRVSSTKFPASTGCRTRLPLCPVAFCPRNRPSCPRAQGAPHGHSGLAVAFSFRQGVPVRRRHHDHGFDQSGCQGRTGDT